MRFNPTILAKESKEFWKSQKDTVTDIILFGSAARGKPKPDDIDILLLFREKIDKDVEYAYRKKMEKNYPSISVISKTDKTIFDDGFNAREGILFEGYSLITKKRIAGQWGYVPIGLFMYKTKEMTNVRRTQFYYTMNGRGTQKGFLKQANGFRMADNIIATPIEFTDETKEFFDQWGIHYTYVPSIIPGRLARGAILGKVR